MNVLVLVVDDHPLVREVVRTMLEARGYRVATVCNGTEALELFGATHPVVAVVDVDMPGPSGVEVCQLLRDAAAVENRPLAVWLMTGVERQGLEERAKAAGALGVLAKPFTCEQLAARIADALEVAA